jgi:F-type H+-transporting ATPase subunit epsilon
MPDAQIDFELIIVSPDSVLFEGRVTKLIAPGSSMDIAILPNHTPLYTQLLAGDLIITLENNEEKRIPIDSGIMRVKLNRASIITGFETLKKQ